MKIKVTEAIVDLSGKAIGDLTLRSVCNEVLLGQIPGDESLGGAKKAEMFALAMRIHDEDEPDLKAEEISLLKDRIGRGYSALVTGRAYELLDPPSKLRAVSDAG